MFLYQYSQTVEEDCSMEETFEKAIDEFKRVDHLFYVSLKYTRTVDVLKSVMERMISCIDFCMESLLKYSGEKGKLKEELPKNPGLKSEVVKRVYSHDPEIVEIVNFYLKMRKLVRAEYTKREEFRRHVTMIAVIDKGEIVEVSIDVLKEYYDKTKNFMGLVKRIIREEEYA